MAAAQLPVWKTMWSKQKQIEGIVENYYGLRKNKIEWETHRMGEMNK